MSEKKELRNKFLMNAGILELLRLAESVEKLDLHQINNILIIICCVVSDMEESIDNPEVKRYIVLDLVKTGVIRFCLKRICLEQESDVGIQFSLEIITRMIINSGPSCFLICKETLQENDQTDLLSCIMGLLLRKESSLSSTTFHESCINIMCVLSHSKEGAKLLVNNHLHLFGNILQQYEYSEEVIRLTFLTLWNISANSKDNGLAIFNSGIFVFIFDKAKEVFVPDSLDVRSLSLPVCALMSLALLPINDWTVHEWCVALMDKSVSSSDVPVLERLRNSSQNKK